MNKLILFFIAAFSFNCFATTEIEACMKALSQSEFGGKTNLAPIEIVFNEKIYRWNGDTISQAKVGVKEVRPIWSAGKGRLDSQFPSTEIEKIKAAMMTMAFQGLVSTTAKIKPSQAQAHYKYFSECQGVDTVMLKSVSIGKKAKIEMDKLVEKFPLAFKDKSGKSVNPAQATDVGQ